MLRGNLKPGLGFSLPYPGDVCHFSRKFALLGRCQIILEQISHVFKKCGDYPAFFESVNSINKANDNRY